MGIKPVQKALSEAFPFRLLILYRRLLSRPGATLGVHIGAALLETKFLSDIHPSNPEILVKEFRMLDEVALLGGRMQGPLSTVGQVVIKREGPPARKQATSRGLICRRDSKLERPGDRMQANALPTEPVPCVAPQVVGEGVSGSTTPS